MVKIREITIYACKNTRKNSKYITKRIKAWWGYDNIKKSFNNDDLVDLTEWIKINKEFKYFYVLVYSDSICLHPLNKNYYSEYQVLALYNEFTKLFNLEVNNN